MRKSIVMGAVALAIVIALSLPQMGSEEQERERVSVRLPIPIVEAGQTAFYVAKEKGYYEDEGLEVEPRHGSAELNPIKMVESGIEGLWTPILINRIGYCEHHCVLCGQVCPTGAIRNITIPEKIGEPPFEQPMKLGTAFYDRGRCLPWAMHVECIVCEEMCSTSPKAIWFEEAAIRNREGGSIKLKQPYVDPRLCIGCGICENKCPVEDLPAIRVSSVGETRSKKNQMILNG